MSDAEKGAGTLSGLNEREAKEFHNLFISGFLFFVFVAIVAHFLVWQWRPWLPGTSGYVTAMVDQAKLVAAYIPHVLTA